MDYKQVLSHYHYENYEGIISRIQKSNGCSTQENQDILNEIMLWKTNRIITVSDEIIKTIIGWEFQYPLEAARNEGVHDIFQELLGAKGVQAPLASTILKMYHPHLFPIIDQRAYREIYNKEFPKFYSKDAYSRYADMYVKYVIDCYYYQQEKCPDIKFCDLDKLLYQLDIEKGNKVKY